MDKQYNELNEFLDKCINDALQETTSKFQVGKNNSREVDYEQYEKTNRFNGFEEDKEDPEGEKMKDYEKRPYKIYQRPLTEEERRSYQKYEDDLTKLKPGQTQPNWDGYDRNLRGFDKTEDYSKYKKPQSSKTEQQKGTNHRYYQPQPEQMKDSVQETYKSSSKEAEISPRFNEPEIPKWNFRPKFADVERPQSTSDTTRRHSDPAPTHRPEVTSNEYGFDRPPRPFGNVYRNVSQSDLKPEQNKEDFRPEQPQDVQKEKKGENKNEMKPGMNAEEVKQELLKLRPNIIERASWGALPPMRKVTMMKPPADTLVFSFNTGTPECRSEDECRRTVREIQARHMGKGLADIQYNFLVGGDGNLYEGRGWALESGINPEKEQGKNYNIAFIGDFQGDINNIPPHMLGPVQELILWGNAVRLMTGETKSAGEYRIPKKDE